MPGYVVYITDGETFIIAFNIFFALCLQAYLNKACELKIIPKRAILTVSLLVLPSQNNVLIRFFKLLIFIVR